MDIDFTFSATTKVPLPSYLYAYLEGNINISHLGISLFSESGILLIELAVQITKWFKICNKAHQDFHYISIEHDSPIFSLIRDSSKCYTLYAWSEYVDSPPLEYNTVSNAFENYLLSLNHFIEINMPNLYQSYLVVLNQNL